MSLDDWALSLTILGVLVTISAAVVTVLVYLKEKEQLLKIGLLAAETTEIGKETQDIAKTLKAARERDDAVARFLNYPSAKPRKYTCVFPVFFKQRPLPFVFAGDYHALQVLVNLLGEERLDLCGIMPNEPVPEHLMSGDIIHLCTPFANSALQSRLPALKVDDQTTAEPADFDALDLPCWFAEDTRTTNRYAGGAMKSIMIRTDGHPIQLDSPAEEHYVVASQLHNDQRYTPQNAIQRDLAILIRRTDSKSGSKLIVIAGIHQYGTWIAADFLDRHCRGAKLSYRKVFEGSADFAVVVWGSFDGRQLRVLDTDVEQNYIWTMESGAWVQVPVALR